MTAPALLAGSPRSPRRGRTPPSFCAVLAPTRDEAEALRLAEDYLKRAGTQVASSLLGCPKPDGEAMLVADLGDVLLRSAALCTGLRGLAVADDRRGS
jgi:hypothetical protein